MPGTRRSHYRQYQRMKRRLLTLLTLLSLLPAMAVVVLWVRSHAGPDYLHYVSARHWSLSVISGHGTVDVLVIPDWRQDPELRVGRYDPYVYYGTRYSKRVLGFGTDVQWPEYGGRYVNIPHWFLALLASLPPALGLWRMHRRRHRATPGFCPRCAYDLRATPGRCPECGTACNTPTPPRPAAA
jgi:hypothetical protein